VRYLLKYFPLAAEMALPKVPVCISLSAVNMAGSSLRDIHVATASEAECRQWLRANALLVNRMDCPKCNAVMSQKTYSRVADGITWHCPEKTCRTTVSIRRGSFFESSHQIANWMALIDYITSRRMPQCHTNSSFNKPATVCNKHLIVDYQT